ncbi:MAG: hypothetical protein KKG59_04040 [Nanoarchaeota archaeon]|nr:hypothetical protein [Nanoarchaeota archaeon]
MSEFNVKKFFSPPKNILIGFIALYILIMAVVGIASKTLFVSTCSTCSANIPNTFLYYLVSMIIVYFLFCWAIHVWGKLTVKLENK